MLKRCLHLNILSMLLFRSLQMASLDNLSCLLLIVLIASYCVYIMQLGPLIKNLLFWC